jgi:hypothetical protein
LLAANYGLQHYQDAIQNANELFQSADTAKTHYRYMPYDYRYQALSMFSLESIDSLSTGEAGLEAAIDVMDKGLETGLDLSQDMGVTMGQRELATAQYNQMSGDIRKLVNALIAQGKYDQALHIRKYQMSKKNPNDIIINDWADLLAVLQKKYENTTDATEKSIAQRELLSLYTKIEQDFPTDPQVCGIYFNHALALAATDENNGSGNALPLFTKLFNLERNNMTRDSSDEQYIAYAAQYMSVYYFYNSDYVNAMKYALYMMDSDITYDMGDKIFGACSKAKPKTAARLRAEHRPLYYNI